MGRIYDKYLELKDIDNKYLYLFKSGSFYIFLDDDARVVSKVTLLRLTKYSNDIVKCGFPYNSMDKYMELFNNLNLKVKVIQDNSLELQKLLNYIRKIDINNISNIDSTDLLLRLRNLL